MCLAVFAPAAAHDVAAPVTVVLPPIVVHAECVAQLVGQDVGRAEPSGGVQSPDGSHHSELNYTPSYG